QTRFWHAASVRKWDATIHARAATVANTSESVGDQFGLGAGADFVGGHFDLDFHRLAEQITGLRGVLLLTDVAHEPLGNAEGDVARSPDLALVARAIGAALHRQAPLPDGGRDQSGGNLFLNRLIRFGTQVAIVLQERNQRIDLEHARLDRLRVLV